MSFDDIRQCLLQFHPVENDLWQHALVCSAMARTVRTDGGNVAKSCQDHNTGQ